MKKILLSLIALVGMSYGMESQAQFYPHPHPAPVRRVGVHCSSEHYRYHTCSVAIDRDDRIVEVRLVRQFSHSSCAGNYGSTGNAVWVNNGCEGDFEVLVEDRGHGGGGYGHVEQQTIRCASEGSRTETCYANGEIEDIRLVSQESRSACYEGRTFGAAGNSIWVTNGCRGVFEVRIRR